MEVIIYGIVRSIQYLLIALGFSFAYGVSRLPNFAYGAFYIVASYITWGFIRTLKWNYPLSILLSLIIVATMGGTLYRFLLIRVRGMVASEIIASYALGLAILEGLRIKFGRAAFATPVFIDRTVNIAGVPIDMQRLIIIGTGIAVVLLILGFTHYTKVGLSLKAIAQDEHASMMLGIDSDRAAIIALSLGSALVALAAIVVTPTSNLSTEQGYDVLLYALAICVIGGLGSWTGTILASFILGFAGMLTATYIGGMWQSAVVVVAIIITLIIKPSGLFGRQKELEERV